MIAGNSISESISISVTAAYDADLGLSRHLTITLGTQFDSGKLHAEQEIYDDAGYDIDGYNSQGLNAADHYDPLYDENVSRS